MPDTTSHPLDTITFDIDFDNGETLHVTRLPHEPDAAKANYIFQYESDIDDEDDEPDALEFNNDRSALKALEGELYPSSDVVNPRVAECLFIANGILPDDSEANSFHISTRCKNGITVDTYRNVSKRSCSVSYIVDVTDIVKDQQRRSQYMIPYDEQEENAVICKIADLIESYGGNPDDFIDEVDARNVIEGGCRY